MNKIRESRLRFIVEALTLFFALALLSSCQAPRTVRPPPQPPPVQPTSTDHPTLTPAGHPAATHTPLPEHAAGPAAATPIAESGTPWRMFHFDERHTGLVEGVGAIDPAAGPAIRWTYAAAPPALEGSDLRWFSTFPLGDLDGDGTLEVVVTSPDNRLGVRPHVVALKDLPGQEPPVQAIWTYEIDNLDGGVDQYGAALADVDGDGLLDVIFSSRDGYLRALKGTNGALLWQYQTNRIMESGPMVADLDGDGSLEVVQATDCLLAGCPPGGALYVFSVRPAGPGLENPPIWQVEFPWKVDSGEPAIADLDPNDGTGRKAIVVTSWGGKLIVVWQDEAGEVVQNELDLKTLDPGIPADSHAIAVRSSPLLADFGEGMTAVFGWMPDWKDYTQARLSAVGLQADMAMKTVTFTPRWTEPDDDWKSSPALVPVPGQSPLIVSGLGYAIAPAGGFGCIEVYGGFIAREGLTGAQAWEYILPDGIGDVRSSLAVADVDGDGRLEALGGVGCGGNLMAFDALTGDLEWELPLGDLTYVSPSLGDLDGDGFLEILVGSYDGNVYALEGKP